MLLPEPTSVQEVRLDPISIHAHRPLPMYSVFDCVSIVMSMQVLSLINMALLVQWQPSQTHLATNMIRAFPRRPSARPTFSPSPSFTMADAD